MSQPGCGTCGEGTAGKLLHGAVSLVKVAVGVDRTPVAMRTLRYWSCDGNPSDNVSLRVLRCPIKGPSGLFCNDCGCIVAAKTLLASEHCPRGWWPDRELNPAETEAWVRRVNTERSQLISQKTQQI